MAIERSARMAISDIGGTRYESIDHDGHYIYAVMDRATAHSLMSKGATYNDFETRIAEVAQKKHRFCAPAKSRTIRITAADFG
jgi:VCBS repeat-containing protein